MVLTAQFFSSVLQALSLTQGSFKPTPNAGLATSSSLGNSKVTSTSSDYGLPHFYPAGQADDAQGSTPVSPAMPYMQLDAGVCNPTPYDAPPIINQTFPPFDQAKANVYRYRQQQSVNLGSWYVVLLSPYTTRLTIASRFVHEAWMTPSVFACAAGQQLSEIDIANGWNSTATARSVLEHHWDTFINQTDFEYLASIGINTVRLPIGYWSLGPSFCQGTPYANVSDVYQNSWPRVVRTINMAGEAGIGVLVDLHGAPGSQNGQPHSGISDGVTGLFGNPTYENMTISLLTFLMEQLVNVTNVIGIEILNEPQNVPELPDFYSRAIAAMRQVSPAATSFPLYIHDGFNIDQFASFVANRTDFVVVDHHSYFVFTPSDAAESANQHTVDIRTSIASDMTNASSLARRNLVIDEWSCALTPQSLANDPDPNQSRQAFCEGQMDMYTNTTAGWGFWAYDKEDCSDDPGWCFKAAVGNSLPSTFFSYGQGPLTSPGQLPALADLMGDMNAPATSAILASAQNAPTSTSSYSSQSGGWDASPTQAPAMSRRGRLRRRSDPSAWRRKRNSLSALRNHQRDDQATGMSPEQRSIAKGYSDGFFTAKIFALYGMSKLGFIGQYISDSIAKLGPTVVKPGTEGMYRQWFMRGLQDGENIVASHVGQSGG
ncbi:glycoside hydrolase family 5 protein [Wolfiporia cocos MD-104 SS10]|uniref:Glycoside hydrolase family 5 protein n=1 Tax=Wolfiporia cocos (strain MD-104) TaxID=742152 RepID=A0A2H3J798_WOLCO|nr:glycoside hydrolase family 5 protein [Wolfiporia cocos MD-104 SS10]